MNIARNIGLVLWSGFSIVAPLAIAVRLEHRANAQAQLQSRSSIGREVAVPRHLADGDEFTSPLKDLLAHGKLLFDANWTDQEGGGRPLTKGTGRPLADPSRPVTGARAFNRISGPDANSCAGCHNAPYAFSGGGGDFVTNVFVLGQRFDSITFDPSDSLPTRGGVDEAGQPVSLLDAANSRSSTGMFGAGYLEMLARQITEELQRQRDSIHVGETKELVAKGIHFGSLTLTRTGLWDTSKVEGLGRLSLLSTASNNPPTLVIRPWHQASNVVSLREFSNNAFNQHHGIQSTERFGLNTDPDGDGFVNEMTRADVTAVSVWQATLQVPGRVIPRDPAIEQAVLAGERTFERVGCASCHVPRLPLTGNGRIYSEPNPFNPAGNLRTGETRDLRVDLSNDALPAPRLQPDTAGTVWVEAYTDFKLHDICGPGEAEPLDMNQSQWSRKLQQGNCRFLTKRLWGAANEPPFYHHGMFTTLRQAVLAHAGEALESRRAFEALPAADSGAVIEFLKTLQVLPPGTKDRIVDETFRARPWPPTPTPTQTRSTTGDERAVPHHLADGDELKLSVAELVDAGRRLFTANWTVQDGGGRPLSKGTGRPLSDRTQPLSGLRAFNRISGPEGNSCQGCHRAPFAGGGGDVTANVFELASRFDFVTFDRRDATVTRGSADERRRPATLDTVGNQRVTRGLFGAGYLEMAARQITAELRRVRDTIQPGQSRALAASGISYGTLARRADGTWDTHAVEGLPAQSLVSASSASKPGLVVRPWQQSGSAVSLRGMTVASFNQHHGMQATERFGVGTDPDGDGVVNELTRGDITAVLAFEAALPVPGRVIPNDAGVEAAIETGERAFDEMRCSACHVSSLPLARESWTFVDPNPYDAAASARAAAPRRAVHIDLTSRELPQPRLAAGEVLILPAYTDFKLHDITDPGDATAAEPLDMNQPTGSAKFAAGNRRFLTRRLWGVASQMPYFHDGRFTTMRQAILAHHGEALASRQAFERASRSDQDALIEFLKSLQVLPPGTKSLVVDERYQPKAWPRRASPTYNAEAGNHVQRKAR